MEDGCIPALVRAMVGLVLAVRAVEQPISRILLPVVIVRQPVPEVDAGHLLLGFQVRGPRLHVKVRPESTRAGISESRNDDVDKNEARDRHLKQLPAYTSHDTAVAITRGQSRPGICFEDPLSRTAPAPAHLTNCATRALSMCSLFPEAENNMSQIGRSCGIAMDEDDKPGIRCRALPRSQGQQPPRTE
eukprot:2880069-Rhodomonas_salina.1